MIDTTIYIGNIAIHEPVTVFSDCIIMLLCFYFYSKLKSINETLKYWRLFFLFLGLSTIIGACSHAFFAIHEGLGYKSFWLTMQIINCLAVYYAQMATLSSVLKSSKFYAIWKWSYIIQLVLFSILIIVIQKYLVTVIENVIGFVPIIIVHLMAKQKVAYYKLVAYGICVSFFAGVVHSSKITLHAYMNYNDIAHVFIMLSITVIYWGVKKSATYFQSSI